MRLSGNADISIKQVDSSMLELVIGAKWGSRGAPYFGKQSFGRINRTTSRRS